MRKYSIEQYPENLRGIFQFLIKDFGFELIEDTEREFSYLVVFAKDNLRIRLNYDYMDNYFYFIVINGKNIVYSDEEDENVITISDLAKMKNANINLQDLQPSDTQYLEALRANAEIIKKYGRGILKGSP